MFVKGILTKSIWYDTKRRNNKGIYLSVSNHRYCTYEYNNNYGSFKEKHSKAFKNYPKFSKPVIQMTLDGKFIQEFPSIAEAARQLNGSYVNIAEYLREPNKRNHAYGYKWKYKGID